MKSPVQELLIDALRDAGNARRSDAIAVEEPLEIRLMRDGLPEADENGGTGRSISVTMRTPGHDAELAVGFLHGEGLLRERRDVIDAGHCDPTSNILRVTVRHDLPLDLARLARNFYATSSCGVCGKASIDAVTASAGGRRISGGAVVREAVLRRMPDTLRLAQTGFAETGGMHAVGLFTADGELIASREDVGRHNAMDKLIGASLLGRELPWGERMVMVSGRLSFELVQKAARAGAAVLAGVSAPSSLAVELAEACGMTL